MRRLLLTASATWLLSSGALGPDHLRQLDFHILERECLQECVDLAPNESRKLSP